MVTKDQIISEITNYAVSKINTLSDKSILFDIVVKPFISEVVEVNMQKLDNVLSLVTNEQGLINADRLITNITDNLIVSPIKNFKGVFVGDGKIEINLPMIGGSIVFDKSDFEELRSNINKHIK